MNLPYELFFFMVAFFILAMIATIVQARRKKDKTGYFVALIPFFMILAFIFAILNQLVLVIVFFASAAIIAFASFPKVTKMLEQQGVELARKVDLSAPLRRRDFLTTKMWLVLAYRWGIWKTIGIFSLFAITLSAGILTLILSMWGIMGLWYLVGYTIFSTIGTVTLFYRQISKALMESKLSKHQRT